MPNDAIIAVRPRQGTALERIHVEYRQKGVSMADVVHSWAEKAEGEPIVGGKASPPITAAERVRQIAAHRELAGSSQADALWAVRNGWRDPR